MRMKARVNLTVEHDLLKQAREKLINVSSLTERAIRDKLGEKTVIPTDEDVCNFCGRKERKATADNLNGLSWLYPDEKWICNSCLRSQSLNCAV